MGDGFPLLWLCGPSGVGKTTVGWDIFGRIAATGTPAGYLDADQLGLCYPAPADDPETHRVKARNLGAMTRTLRAAGARCLILSGGVQHPDQVRRYAEAVPGCALTLCRLRAGPGELRTRFLGRGWRPELVAENERAAAALDRSDFGGLSVDTTGLSVPRTARRVLDRAGGWPGRPEPAAAAAGEAPPSPPPAPAATRSSVPVLWVCGPRGVGKSEVAWAVFAELFASGVTAAYVDLAQLGFRRPVPADDPSGHRLRARGLAAVWPAYRAAGARCLILSGAVGDPETVRACAEAVPEGTFTLVRLHAGPGVLRERILRRGRGRGPQLPGDELKGRPPAELLSRAEAAAREAETLERAGTGMARVATDGRTIGEIADEVRRLLPDLRAPEAGRQDVPDARGSG
ncbi:AAA family ATPase [Streptomyces aidingensis]|uniref:Broad-specificity NMP kinase n=1 Tax=Streptomyces aidingensis TaxID=910347 RepID=A0A1I1MWD6_9ACTN|nr:AAA family ATPase [Streptomyces aidingensis]SFC89222.1 Broad-specificity NMP kinase [Streptomyces aidingensis]